MGSRRYGMILTTFYTGPTGVKIRRAGERPQHVALYTCTSPSTSMLGFFYLPVSTIAHDTGIPLEGAREALVSLQAVGFCEYDDETEWVWIPELARYQLGEILGPKDNRHKAMLGKLQESKGSVFYGKFLDRYRVPYQIPDESPFKAPPKPLRSQEQDQEQDQDQEQEKREATGGVLPFPGSVPARAVAGLAPPEDVAPFLLFPCKDGRAWSLTEDQVRKWEASYRGMSVDVRGELRHALVWAETHPTQRKTSAGWPKCLARWLSKEARERAANRQRPEVCKLAPGTTAAHVAAAEAFDLEAGLL
jgi:hypothetical protein